MLSTSALTMDLLKSMRTHTDPLADETVSAIIELGFEEKINAILVNLQRNESFDPKQLSHLPASIQKIITTYFTESAHMPSWADQTLILQGQNVFREFGPEIFMLLNLKSLPMCYTCANGAQVLYDTGRLVEHHGRIDPLVRRLMETAQMVINVLQPGGLEPSGKGIITVQKVRLIHASIRHFLKSQKYNPIGWDAQKLGEPINQEDLAGTLMSFSPLILSGLAQLNIKLSQEQTHAYSHCWQVFGHLIGLRDDLLSDDYETNWALAIAILKNQAATSEAGKALTDSCISFIQHMIPGNLFDEVPEYMIWFFFQDIQEAVQKSLTKMIGIEDHHTLKDYLVLKFSKIIVSTISHSEHNSTIEKLTGEFNKLMLQGCVQHYNDSKQVRFLIPPSLSQDWGIDQF